MKSAQSQTLSLEEFVDKLITEKGLQDLEAEILAEIKNDLLKRVEDRINAVILEKMPPEKIEYFEKMLDNSDEKEIQDFCSRNIFGLDKIIAAELLSFKNTYLNT